MSKGKTIGIIIGAVAVVGIAAAGLYLVDFDQTKEAQLPKVEIENGQLPEFDVEVADVDVGMQKTDVKVPTVEVDVDTTDVEVTVPTIDIDKPDEDDPADNPQ